MAAISTMILLGSVLGLILGISSKLLFVAIDERVATVTSMLPGYNCGSCGQPGCSGLAENLVSGSITKVSVCKPSKPDQRLKIVEYLNNSVGPNGEKVTVTV